MGKNSPNSPPTWLAQHSGSVAPSRVSSPRPIVGPCAPKPTKIICPSAVDAANTSRPPSPAPLISSLSSSIPVVTCYDAGPAPPSSPPQSPVDDDNDIFFDALDNFPDIDIDNLPGIDEPHSHKPVHAQVVQVLPGPAYDGAAKGRTNVGPSRGSTRSTVRTTYAPPPPTYYAPPARGSSKPTFSPGTHSSFVPLAFQAQQNAALQRPTDNVPRREPTRKALLVGINYPDMGKEKRLWYAVEDAARFGKSLKTLGFQHHNIKLVTDESFNVEKPTLPVLMDSIDWLVGGARDGDVLFFVFSGHCVKDRGLVTADKRFISREMLHGHLVMRIPEGCDLQIVFDCCSAAAMIQLPYCIGRMGPLPQELAHSEQSTEKTAECGSETDPLLTAELLCPTAQPRPEPPHLEPLQGSFQGLSAVAPASPASPASPAAPVPPAAPAPITPPMVNLETFAPAPSNPVVSHRRGGVVAAPPVPSPAPAATDITSALGAVAQQATGYVTSWFGRGHAAAEPARPSTPAVPSRVGTPGPARASASGDSRRVRQVVVEGERTPDHFEERKGYCVRPAGNVTVWAGSGEEQQAFEAYGGVKHGIVTNAMCTALDACATTNNMLNRRDFWRFLVGAIDKENTHRSERDANKGLSDRPDPKLRVQHAQLWVSQAESLSSAAPMLDKPMIEI